MNLTDPKYLDRLNFELREIEVKGKEEHFLKLAKAWVNYAKEHPEDKNRPENENNLLVSYLLNIVSSVDIESEPNIVYGDFPDIDVDFIREVRDYIKDEWIPKTFGEDKVCNISNYTTFGLRSALTDMARVHGQDRSEITKITKQLDLKDDEGNSLTWESALNLYQDLAEYCKKYPDVAAAAHRLLHRNRGFGKHAAGVIISNVPIADTVPLLKRKDSPPASAWVEGLHGQDLQPVGFIKFDLLVISNLIQIAKGCDIVKKTYDPNDPEQCSRVVRAVADRIKNETGAASICALPGQPDWSDVARWRNDPDAIAMANRADLKCIFQFDSEGIRALVREGGVESFDDLVAYASLYRPGPLGMGMHKVYIENKRDESKKWLAKLPPLLRPILENTYAVICYQEQIMKILNVVGEIPLRDCELVRKAISKKKVEIFASYKDMFIQNGQKNMGWTERQMEHLWSQVEAFSEYGFNLCVLKSTLVPFPGGAKEISSFEPGDSVYCVNERGETVETEVIAVHDNGVLDAFEVEFDDGYKVVCTANHKFLTKEGQVSLQEICEKRSLIMCAHYKGKVSERCDVDSDGHDLFYQWGDRMVGLATEHAPITDTSRLVCRKVVRVRAVGKQQMCDLEVANPTHNFLLPNGIVTSNSHAVAYTYVSSQLLYLKVHFPKQFYSAILSVEDENDKIAEYKREAEFHDVSIERPNVNKSNVFFDLIDNKVYYGLAQIKGIGEAVAEKIVKGQPYTSFEDFLTRCGTDASMVKPLIGLRCFDIKEDAVKMYKFSEYFKDAHKKHEDRIKRAEASLERYEEQFSKLVPNESRNLSEIVEFIDEEWQQYNVDETQTGTRITQCKPEESEFSKIVLEKIHDGVELECEKFYRSVSVNKTSNKFKDLKRIWSRRKNTLRRLKHMKSKEFKPPTLDEFDENCWEIENSLIEELRNPSACEDKYLGFRWIHELQKSPDFNSKLTFDQFTGNSAAVQVKVLKTECRKSQKGNVYYQAEVEDANGVQQKVNIWSNDWDRWQDEIKEDNLLMMRLNAPSGGFKTYSLQSYPRNRQQPDKIDDSRIIIMKKAEIQNDKVYTMEEVLEQFNGHGAF